MISKLNHFKWKKQIEIIKLTSNIKNAANITQLKKQNYKFNHKQKSYKNDSQ